MEQKAKNDVALRRRMASTVRDEAPCIIAAAIFLAIMAAFLMILFSKMVW